MYKVIVTLMAAAFLATNPALAKPDHAKNGNKGLPPGLEKKAERGQPLPPGWQKKVHKGDILEASIYAHATFLSPVGKDGSVKVEIEGNLFRIHKETHKVLEVLKAH